MAKVISIIFRRTSPTGIICKSVRQIVVWGSAAENLPVDRLESALIDEEQLIADPKRAKSRIDVVREICDKLFPNSWDFVAQGGTIEF